jgi:F0F1-type ATP synthase membrane subunit b/b'
MKGDLAERIASMRQTMLREATEHRERAIAAAERAGAQEANSISADLRKRVDELTRIPDAKRKKAVRRAVELVLS